MNTTTPPTAYLNRLTRGTLKTITAHAGSYTPDFQTLDQITQHARDIIDGGTTNCVERLCCLPAMREDYLHLIRATDRERRQQTDQLNQDIAAAFQSIVQAELSSLNLHITNYYFKTAPQQPTT